jgi:hypothetical protein
MLALLLVAKRFGNHLELHIALWRKLGLAEFVKDHRKRRSNAFTAVSRFYGLSSQNAESSTGSNSFM